MGFSSKYIQNLASCHYLHYYTLFLATIISHKAYANNPLTGLPASALAPIILSSLSTTTSLFHV